MFFSHQQGFDVNWGFALFFSVVTVTDKKFNKSKFN
jgi:hypothetical protein